MSVVVERDFTMIFVAEEGTFIRNLFPDGWRDAWKRNFVDICDSELCAGRKYHFEYKRN